MSNNLETAIRQTCLSFPEATEKLSHGSPAFFAGRQFAMLWMRGITITLRSLMVCRARRVQSALIASTRSGTSIRPTSDLADGSAFVSRTTSTSTNSTAPGRRVSMRRVETPVGRTRAGAVNATGLFVRAGGTPTQHREVARVDHEAILRLAAVVRSRKNSSGASISPPQTSQTRCPCVSEARW